MMGSSLTLTASFVARVMARSFFLTTSGTFFSVMPSKIFFPIFLVSSTLAVSAATRPLAMLLREGSERNGLLSVRYETSV